MNDQRLGLAVRALRRRRSWRQVDLGMEACVPQSTISDIEHGHLDDVPLRTLRAVFAALEARGEIDLVWRGGALDRLLDERHARLVEQAITTLMGYGWQTVPELTYSEYGERGSIDVVGVRTEIRAALIAEVKSEIAAVEATNRRFDPKIRLGPTIIRKRFGFEPTVIGAVLVLPEASTARRRVEEHRSTFEALYPARAREIRTWLERPAGSLRGIWFLSDIAAGDRKGRPAARIRARRCGSPIGGHVRELQSPPGSATGDH